MEQQSHNVDPSPSAVQEPSRSGTISLRSILFAVLKRPWIPVIVVLLITIPASFIFLSSVRLYRSQAEVMVPVREVTSSMADLIGGGREPAKPLHYYSSILNSKRYREDVSERLQSMGYDISTVAVQNRLYVANKTREPGLFTLFTLTPNMDIAQVMVQAGVEEFRESIASFDQQDARAVVEFINEQLDDLNEKTIRAEERLQDFLRENQFVLENPEIGIAQELTKLENQLVEEETKLQLINLDIQSIQNQIESLLSDDSGGTSTEYQQRLSELRSQRDELEMAISAARETGASRTKIDSLQTRLRAVSASLIRLNADAIGSGSEPQSITLSSLRDILEELTVERKRAQNRVEFFEAKLQTFREVHPNISEDILTYTQLQRQRDVLTQTLSILLEKKEEARIKMASKLGGVKVLDDPTEPQPQARNTIIRLLVTLLFSTVLGVALAFVFDFLRATIDAEPDIVQNFTFPLLGVVPRIQQKHIKKNQQRKGTDEDVNTPDPSLVSNLSSHSWFLEALRAIRTSLLFHAAELNANVFAISSPMPVEGKTLTTGNMAILFQRGGSRTIVLDCDLRKPKQHRQFGLSRKPGLSDYLLADDMPFEDVIQKTHEKNLDFIGVGSTFHDPTELLASRKMRELVNILRKKYDYVFVDTSPILPAVDSRLIGEYVDGMILIARAEWTKIRSFQSTVDLLNNINIRIIGAILNHADRRYNNLYYYSYGRYYSYYQYYYRPYTYYGSYGEENSMEVEEETTQGAEGQVSDREGSQGPDTRRMD